MGVALGGVATGLLVTYLHVPEVGVNQGIVCRQIGTTGDTEDVIHTFGPK